MVEQVGDPSPVPVGILVAQRVVNRLRVLPVFLAVNAQSHVLAIQLLGKRQQADVEPLGMPVQVGGQVLAV